MKRTSVFFGALLSIALAAGCSEESAGAIPEVSVERASTLFAAGEAVAVDANGASTRQEHGVVPGARLLTSSGSYDPAAELPADHATALIFYCGNTDCRASDGAAERASEAGYTNVNVMRAGIAGWVEAGHRVDRPQS
jgi:rhodanese-related sulfurtransferase